MSSESMVFTTRIKDSKEVLGIFIFIFYFFKNRFVTFCVHQLF